MDKAESVFQEILGAPPYQGSDMWLVPGGGHFAVVKGVPKAYLQSSTTSNAIQIAINTMPPEVIFSIVGLQYTKDKELIRTVLKLEPYVMAGITEDGVPPTMDVESSSAKVRLVHKGMGFIIPQSIYLMEDPFIRDFIRYCHDVIQKSIVSTLLHTTLRVMFGESEAYSVNHMTNEKIPYTKKIQNHSQNFALLNKSETEMLKGISALKEHMVFNNAKPSHLIVPRGTKHLIAFDDHTRTYSNRGNAAEKLVKDGIGALGTICGLTVVEVPSFNVLDTMDDIDPSCKVAEIGTYFQLIDVTGEDTSKFSTQTCYETDVLDASIGRGSKTRITARACLSNCHFFENGELHQNHQDVVDDINILKQKFAFSDNDHEDCMFISWDIDKRKYKVMNHIGEMHKCDLTKNYLKKFASTCMNSLEKIGNDSRDKLANFSNDMLDLNEATLANNDVKAWLMAFYISTQYGYENYKKMAPLPPRIGSEGLSIMDSAGNWCYLFLNENENGSITYQVKKSSSLNQDDEKKKCFLKMKPIGYGSAPGIRILSTMYRNDEDRGYDKDMLKKFSRIHELLESLYRIWRNMFPLHDLDNPCALPSMFKDFVRPEHQEYTAWVSSLCLPLQNPTFLFVENHLQKDRRRDTFRYTAIPETISEEATEKPHILDFLCLDKSNYSTESVFFTGVNTTNTHAKIITETNKANLSVGGRSCQFINHLPTAPIGSSYSIGYCDTQSAKNHGKSVARIATARKLLTNTDFKTTSVDGNSFIALTDNLIFTPSKRVGIYHANVVNNYNYWSFKETNPIKRMFILSLITQNINYKAFDGLLSTDALLPMSFDLDRPRQRYVMGDAVMMEGDGVAQTTYYGHKYEGMAHDLNHAEYHVRCTMNVGSQINDPTKLQRLENAICRQYLNGESTRFIKNAQELETLLHRPDEADAHIFVKAMPYRNYISKDPKDFYGKWGLSAYKLTESGPDQNEMKPHRRNTMYYYKLWQNWAFSGSAHHSINSDMNTVMFPGFQMYYDPLRKTNLKIADQGPFRTINWMDYILSRESKIHQENLPGEFI